MVQEEGVKTTEFLKITRTARRTVVDVLKDSDQVSFSPHPMAGSFMSDVKAGDRHVWVLRDDGNWLKEMEVSCPRCGTRPMSEYEPLGSIESWRSEEHNTLHYRIVIRHSCGQPVGNLWTSSSIKEFDSKVIPGPDEYLGEYIHCGSEGFLYRESGKLVWKNEKV